VPPVKEKRWKRWNCILKQTGIGPAQGARSTTQNMETRKMFGVVNVGEYLRLNIKHEANLHHIKIPPAGNAGEERGCC